MNLNSRPRSLFDKIWDAHDIRCDLEEYSLLYVDRLLLEDSSYDVFERLDNERLSVRSPGQVFSTIDHYAPTGPAGKLDSAGQMERIRLFSDQCRRLGLNHFPLGDSRQGITHVIGPELGLTLPGMLLVCCDSHTSTHGALGALSFGIGSSEAVHVLATQAIRQRRPRQMRIWLEGTTGFGVTAKDLALSLIARIGTDGARGYAVEYAGSAARALSVEERMTLCNMTIEAGARIAMIAPDDIVFQYIEGRPLAPCAEAWDQAMLYWSTLGSHPDSAFDREIEFCVDSVTPMVSWGISPDQCLPITEAVPDPKQETQASRRLSMKRALDYMGLVPGTRLSDIRIDRVFIGSCTNSRISDLRAAASVVRGRRAVVPSIVVPGSWAVRREAEAEGLDQVFREAGFEWREPGCSMCVAMNGDQVAPGERCAATSNRNFVGRQGPGARTHLMSPAMAAAAGLAGHLTDVRRLLLKQSR